MLVQRKCKSDGNDDSGLNTAAKMSTFGIIVVVVYMYTVYTLQLHRAQHTSRNVD